MESPVEALVALDLHGEGLVGSLDVLHLLIQSLLLGLHVILDLDQVRRGVVMKHL